MFHSVPAMGWDEYVAAVARVVNGPHRPRRSVNRHAPFIRSEEDGENPPLSDGGYRKPGLTLARGRGPREASSEAFVRLAVMGPTFFVRTDGGARRCSRAHVQGHIVFGGPEPFPRRRSYRASAVLKTLVAIATIPATSATLAGMTMVVPFWAS